MGSKDCEWAGAGRGEAGAGLFWGGRNARLFRFGLSWSRPPWLCPSPLSPWEAGRHSSTSLGERRTPSTGTAHYLESVVGCPIAGDNSRCANDASRRGFAAWLSTTHRHFARLCSPRKNTVTCMLRSPTAAAAASSHIMNSLSHHEFMGAARAAGVCVTLCLLRVCRMGWPGCIAQVHIRWRNEC